MASSEPRYVCQECGHEAHKWMGKCTGCGAWNTLVKETESADVEAQVPDLSTDGQNGTAAAQNQPTQLTDVEMEGESRLKTGVDELDRVMGGGIMQGSFSLIAGDPGIGKSTLMTELGGYLPGRKILYVTGEESKRQVKLRAQRLGVDSDALYLLAETNVQEIANAVDDVAPDLLVADSIQTIYRPDLTSAPGSVSRRERLHGRVLPGGHPAHPGRDSGARHAHLLQHPPAHRHRLRGPAAADDSGGVGEARRTGLQRP